MYSYWLAGCWRRDFQIKLKIEAVQQDFLSVRLISKKQRATIVVGGGGGSQFPSVSSAENTECTWTHHLTRCPGHYDIARSTRGCLDRFGELPVLDGCEETL